jgi:hypothetical protein
MRQVREPCKTESVYRSSCAVSRHRKGVIYKSELSLKSSSASWSDSFADVCRGLATSVRIRDGYAAGHSLSSFRVTAYATLHPRFFIVFGRAKRKAKSKNVM